MTIGKADASGDPSIGDESSLFEDLIEEITDRLEAGEPVDVEDYVSRQPESADRLRRLFPSLRAMAGLGRAAEAASYPGPDLEDVAGGRTLGDFRLLRVAGRGGMGVVYEAEQISLGRRVALKVLPFAGAIDAKHLRRFHLEAQAAAGLHHTNVVPVYSVGCERGVHYYAMQFIEGRTLADVISELRRLEGVTEIAAPGTSTARRQRAVSREDRGRGGDRAPGAPSVRGDADGGPSESPGDAAPAAVDRGSAAGQRSGARPGTGTASRSGAHCRSAARLARQAAEALAYAHDRAVLHRDVKPSNLLVDTAGKLWVADFGLARLQGDNDLTATGDVLGTLRYMSPEQALGRRVVVDQRTDVYSLGVTLYELLTLRPAFEGDDRHEILRRIAEVEPPAPRRLNPAVPIDLETIVLKAMDKDPAARYGAADELAADLDRFLSDRPVSARRPTPADRLAKWSRRHATAVATAAAILAVAVPALVLGAAMIWHERDLALRAVDSEREQRKAAEDARRLLEAEHAADALGIDALRRDLGRLGLEIRTRPSDPGPVERRAYLAARTGLFDQAASDWERAIALQPDEPWHWYRLGHALLYLGEFDSARERWRQMRDRFAPTANHQVAEMIAKLYLLHPDPDGDLPAAAALADKALSPGHWEGHRPWFLLTKALAEYRSGRADSALEAVEEYKAADQAVAAGHSGFREILALLVEALSLKRLGAADDARVAYAGAVAALRGVPKAGVRDIGDVEGWLVHQIVLREAESAFGPGRDEGP